MGFFLCAVLAAGSLYQAIGALRDRRRYPPPGRMLRGLHIYEQGTGAIPIVLEAGVAGTSLGWRRVETDAARHTRVVSYDRAGLGWSHTSTRPRTLANIVDELRALLQTAGIHPPYILAGHSFGGLIIRFFAATYPAEVSALLFIDAIPVADWHPLTPRQRFRIILAGFLAHCGIWLARFGLVRLVLPHLHNSFTDEFRKLPPDVWPMVIAHWSNPKTFRALADYLSALPANAATAASLSIPPGIPAVALCSDHPATPEPGIRSRHIADCGHWIQLDHPAEITQALQTLLPQPGAPAVSAAGL